MRAWYNKNMSVGLLYTCTMGGVRPDRPVALIQNHERNGTDVAEVVPMEHQLPQQREQVSSCLPLECIYPLNCVTLHPLQHIVMM